MVKLPLSHDLKLHFYSFVTIFSKLQTPQSKISSRIVDCAIIHQNPDIEIEYFTQF